MKIDSRIVAYYILSQFEKKGSQIPMIRDAIYSKYSLKNNLKQKATVLVNGVIRLRGRLDLMITFISSKNISRLDKSVLTILRIGFYEIIFESKVPDYAAVNSSVSLAHKFSNKKTVGFTNAVLRNLVRRKNINKNWYKSLESHRGWFSIPAWIEKRWLKHFGKRNFLKLIDFINQPAKTYIRCDSNINSMEKNMSLLEEDGIESELYLNKFLLLKSSSSKILASKLFKKGKISIQSPSAAAIVDCLEAKVGDVVLDVCAAPGTKTLQLANLVGSDGYVYASDISLTRVTTGERDIIRHGKKNIKWSVKDARKSSYQIADKILIDAPCSGTGVIGRRPDIRWRRKESDLKKFSDIQLSIINHCSKFLKKGGTLVYATCSIEPEENSMVMEQFLNLNSNFIVEEIPNSIPDPWIKDKVTLNILPHDHGIDGIFAMRMKKT